MIESILITRCSVDNINFNVHQHVGISYKLKQRTWKLVIKILTFITLLTYFSYKQRMQKKLKTSGMHENMFPISKMIPDGENNFMQN